MYHYTECGLDNVRLANGYKVESTPYGEAVSIDNVDGLHQAIARELAKSRGPITAKAFRFLRTEMNLSQTSLGKLLDVSEQMISLYERGEKTPKTLTVAALKTLYLESISEESKFGQRLTELAELDTQLNNLERELKFSEDESGHWAAVDDAA